MYKLLIADDEFLEVEILKNIVQEYFQEIEIFEAKNGLEAKEIFDTHDIDMAILDIKMPGMTGLEVASYIKQKNTKVEIIISTAFGEFDYAKKAISIDVCDYLLKPVMDNQLIEAIHKMISKLESVKDIIHREKEVVKLKETIESHLIPVTISQDFSVDRSNNLLEQLNMQYSGGYIMLVSSKNDQNIINNIIRVVEHEGKVLGMKSYNYKEGHLIYFLMIETKETNEKFVSKAMNEVFAKVKASSVGIKWAISQNIKRVEDIKDAYICVRSNLYNQNTTNKIIDIRSECNKLFEAIINDSEEQKVYCIGRNIIEFLTTEENIESASRKMFQILSGTCGRMNELTKQEYIETLSIYERLTCCNSYEMLKDNLTAILSDIIELNKACKIDRNSLMMYNVKRYIQENLDKDILLGDVANLVGLSQFYFSKLFKEYYQQSFKEYLIRIRMEEAKKLLTQPELNIKQIALKVGYEDSNYFTRLFKKKVKMLPSEYRSKHLFII